MSVMLFHDGHPDNISNTSLLRAFFLDEPPIPPASGPDEEADAVELTILDSLSESGQQGWLRPGGLTACRRPALEKTFSQTAVGSLLWVSTSSE